MNCASGPFNTRYPITVQRGMLMLPMYVVMVARIRGKISPEVLSDALEQVRNRHFLLGTRVVFEEDGGAFLKRNGAAGLALENVIAQRENSWEDVVRLQLATPFSLETGPLARFVLVEGEVVSHLVICAHHVICDGISLGYLVRDILTVCGRPGTDLEALSVPPIVSAETAATPLRIPRLRRWIISKFRQAWDRKNIRFDAKQQDAMLERYFAVNNQIQFIATELSESETERLVKRCKEEGVTVNSAIWTAFLTAQHKCLPHKRIHTNAGLARSLRGLMRPLVKDHFGFFAASMTFKLSYSPNVSFWELTDRVHGRICNRLKSENPFQLLIMELVHPTLVDSLYFQKLGFIDEKLSKKMLKLAHWHKPYYGCAITNVGRLDIPHNYGDLELEAVFGPVVYSDVNEKTVGVATASGRLSISMTSDGKQISAKDASCVLSEARRILLKNILPNNESRVRQ